MDKMLEQARKELQTLQQQMRDIEMFSLDTPTERERWSVMAAQEWALRMQIDDLERAVA